MARTVSIRVFTCTSLTPGSVSFPVSLLRLPLSSAVPGGADRHSDPPAGVGRVQQECRAAPGEGRAAGLCGHPFFLKAAQTPSSSGSKIQASRPPMAVRLRGDGCFEN
jgi:hypothetical protein